MNFDVLIKRNQKKKNFKVAVSFEQLIRIMPPRKTKNSRRKEVGAPSAASKKAITAIAEEMEEDSIESLLDDFDIQSKGDLEYILNCSTSRSHS